MFFGREDVFGWIERSLEGKFVNHILVLHGQRRVGKTSVLKQIPNFLPDKYIQVFFDLQGRTSTTLDRFLWWLASEIVRTLRREHGINISKPDPKAFEDTEYLLNEFLPGLRPLLGDYVLLLTFDEFDSLDRPEIRESLANPLIAYLRRLIEVEELNFIFSIGSSGDKLENMQASYTDFFKSALYRKISFLTSDDCHRLVTKPVEGVVKYEKKAIDRIVEITSGHPYFTQLMCHELFSRCQKTGARTVSAGDVEAVLEDVVERGTVNLKFVWDEASDLEKWILAALAQMDGGSNQKLSQALTAQRVRFSESDLNSALIHLRDKDVISADNRFVIHLMRLWLVANRPTDRVREELVEVNPIANRYIEIGDEYRDRGQTRQAIESYQQALSANPGNLKAQTNIAAVYLDQKDYEQAASAFELALKIDDEDVFAKTGYCDAHLALGDAARGRGDTSRAVEFYQKILVLNAAHSDARQRLAAIYREQAERQLDAGQDDEALRSFSRAMEFMPEDDQLSSRYNEILAQKKAKMVAEWLGKAEKALSRQRWDEAAEIAEKALQVNPDSRELQAELVKVKDAPRQFKLQGYRREAEGAIARGNWEKAISALETAIQLAPEDKTLRGQLETVQNDRLNAKINLYRGEAEKATAAGDWEAAIAARQFALKLAPGNPELERALEETRQAQHQAKLADFQKQVDEAVAAGDWERAIQSVKSAAKFAPQDAAWKDKLTEVEVARHTAQLNGLRAQAEAAQRAQKWEAALAALESYRKLEPGEANIQIEIEQLRVEKRESELKAFKAQAERAAKAEKWGEAVQAWESYLALQPEDGAGVEEKLQHARKYARIAGDYAEAQDAIRRKRYGRAIELLQGIIAQEPTYKSTSRLLVDAVEANKAIPLWRRPWVFWILGGIAVVLLGVFWGPSLWAIVSQGRQQETTIVETSVPDEVVDDVISPDEVVDDVISHNTVSVTNILTYISGSTPDFEDDFSTVKTEWGTLPERINIASGVLNFILAGQNPELTSDYLLASDFILHYDFKFVEAGTLGISIRDEGSIFQLGQSGWWSLYKGESYYDNGTLDNGIPFYPDDWNQLTIYVQGDHYLYLLNREPVVEFWDDSVSGESITFFAKYPDSVPSEVHIDNLKLWDLSGVDFAATPGTPAPEAATAFYDPILTYADSHPPTFEDDFSTAKSEWGMMMGPGPRSTWVYGPIPQFNRKDSSLYFNEPETDSLTLPNNDLLVCDDFAISIEYANTAGGTPFDFVFRSSSNETEYYKFRYTEQTTWYLSNSGKVVHSGNFQPVAGSTRYSPEDGDVWANIPMNHFLFVVQGENLAIFVNGDLILEFNELALSGEKNFFQVTIGKADNFKFWNLDGVDFNP